MKLEEGYHLPHFCVEAALPGHTPASEINEIFVMMTRENVLPAFFKHNHLLISNNFNSLTRSGQHKTGYIT